MGLGCAHLARVEVVHAARALREEAQREPCGGRPEAPRAVEQVEERAARHVVGHLHAQVGWAG